MRFLSDPILTDGHPNARILNVCGDFDPKRRTVLILASCHGRPLSEYLVMQPKFDCNLIRLETAPIKIAKGQGIDVMNLSAMKECINEANYIISYQLSPLIHGDLALTHVLNYARTGCQPITFTAPNLFLFWPICPNRGRLGVFKAMDNGATEEDVWQAFLDGKFDPMFRDRFDAELSFLKERDEISDIGLSDYIMRMFQCGKLWWAGPHPSFTLMAHVGSEIMKRLGYEGETDLQLLNYDHTISRFDPWPETDYEWKFFGFKYPMRYQHGWEEFYRQQLKEAAEAWRRGFRAIKHADT